MAQARPDLVWQLIEAQPESGEEAAAIGALVPVLGPCLVEGTDARFDKGSLRSLLAFGLYRTLSQMEKLRKVAA